MRLHQRYLGLLPDEQLSNENLTGAVRVDVSKTASSHLRRHLEVAGRFRGGLLFGKRISDVLRVQLVSTYGYPWWFDDFQEALTLPDTHYLLGWADCVNEVYGGQTDWVGNWMAYPENVLGDVRQDLKWVDIGIQLGLVDVRQILLVVGMAEAGISSRAYGYELGEWISIECSMDESGEI